MPPRAFSNLGLSGSPAGSPWWLDIETSNSWRSDVTLNVAALSGAVEYLRSVAHVGSLGFYSTAYQWGVITGGTSAFSAYPSWVAGANDAAGANANCPGPGFTGGGVALAQYVTGGFDADLSCAPAPVLSSIVVSPATASVVAGGSVQFGATGYDQSGQPMSTQPTLTWSVSGGGTIDSTGRFTAGSTAGGPFTVSASSSNVTGTAKVSVTAPPDFSLSVDPPSVSIARGGTATYTVTISPINGFTGGVTLTWVVLPRARPSPSERTRRRLLDRHGQNVTERAEGRVHAHDHGDGRDAGPHCDGDAEAHQVRSGTRSDRRAPPALHHDPG